MAIGLGSLLALERDDRRGDRLACLFLTVSILFSSLGLPFAAGAAVQVLRRPDRWRRLYVVAMPVAIYALWWLGWGHTAESAFSLANVGKAPAFVINGVAASFASAFGLAAPPMATATGGLDWGRPLAVAGIGWPSGGWGAWDGCPLALGRPRDRRFLLDPDGLNQIPGREPTASRYQYVGVIFLLLVVAELLRGFRVGPRSLVAAAVVVAAAIAGNIYFLHESYESYRFTSQLEKADLGALDIARGTVDPGFVLEEDIADTAYVHVEAGPYLEAADEFGSPGYSSAELAEANPQARFAADKVLINALGVGLTTIPNGAVPATQPQPAQPGADGVVPVPARACVSVPAGGSSSSLLASPPTASSSAPGPARSRTCG